MAVPYTAHLNDLHNFRHRYDLAQFEFLMKEEFDQLYEEAAVRKRMMVVSIHDRIGTRPASIRMLDRVFNHIRSRTMFGSLARTRLPRGRLRIAITPRSCAESPQPSAAFPDRIRKTEH